MHLIVFGFPFLCFKGTRDSILFSQTEAENGELSELPTPARSAELHCSRANTSETAREVLLEHSIDQKDEQILVSASYSFCDNQLFKIPLIKCLRHYLVTDWMAVLLLPCM